MAVAPRRIRVWDGPTRLTHWGIAACFALSWWTADTHRMKWHRWSGYVLLGLVLFRLYWGFFGGSTARFASFVRPPRAIWEYVRRLRDPLPDSTLGHNALGALSVIAMLLMLLAQVTLGLFAVDVDGLESGPLSQFVEFDTGRTLAGYHDIGFTVLQWLVGLHIAALLFYTVYRRQRLVVAMITGSKAMQRGWEAEPLRSAPLWVFAIGALLAAGIVWFIAAS